MIPKTTRLTLRRRQLGRALCALCSLVVWSAAVLLPGGAALTIPTDGLNPNMRRLTYYHDDMTGTLPSELGELNQLTYANVGRNTFTGTIPTELGHWTGIHQGFNLYANELTGAVPTQIGRLSLISKIFDLSQNSLQGTIPTQVWFQHHLSKIMPLPRHCLSPGAHRNRSPPTHRLAGLRRWRRTYTSAIRSLLARSRRRSACANL